MGNTLLIKNGRLVDHAKDEVADIYIENGIIKEIGKLKKDCEVIDASGLTVMPAFVDLHAHFRDPGFTYKEDLATGSAAAVAGGYTTVNLMANTKPVCSSLKAAVDVVKLGKEIGKCDVYQCLSLTAGFNGIDISHLDELANDPMQNYVKFISEDGFGIKDGAILYQGLMKLMDVDRTLLIHAEDHDFSKISMEMAEDLETMRDVYVAERLNSKIHFCHVSTKFSAETIVAAKKQGYPITFEVTPHHLALTYDTFYKVNPPLRSEQDRKFLIELIRQGLVDVIATDHAPHSSEDKENGAPGMVGLETAFSVCNTELVKKSGISLQVLSKLMSKSPATLMRINKGELKEGFISDIVIVDPDEEITITSEHFFSKGKNTPFHGKKYIGKVLKTIKAGEIVFSV